MTRQRPRPAIGIARSHLAPANLITQRSNLSSAALRRPASANRRRACCGGAAPRACTRRHHRGPEKHRSVETHRARHRLRNGKVVVARRQASINVKCSSCRGSTAPWPSHNIINFAQPPTAGMASKCSAKIDIYRADIESVSRRPSTFL